MSTINDDSTEYLALLAAQRILCGGDRSLDWRDAGYHSARAAAEVLVGDGGLDPDVWERTVQLVEEDLNS